MGLDTLANLLPERGTAMPMSTDPPVVTLPPDHKARAAAACVAVLIEVHRKLVAKER